MSRLVYRDAVEGDARALSAFARACWLDTFGHLPYPPDDLNAFLDGAFSAAIQRQEIVGEDARYRLALRDDALIGYCMAGALHLPVDDAAGVELKRLYVDESAKGQGVADALMEEALSWARARKASAIYLSVWEDNHRAQRFYRRYGFEDYSEWRFMVGRVADRDLIWRLIL